MLRTCFKSPEYRSPHAGIPRDEARLPKSSPSGAFSRLDGRYLLYCDVLSAFCQFARLGVFVLEVGLLTALMGASIGQRILGLRVVSYPDQLFITPGAAFLRTFLLVLVIPPLVQDEESRGLHERFTKSQVVKVRN